MDHQVVMDALAPLVQEVKLVQQDPGEILDHPGELEPLVWGL